MFLVKVFAPFNTEFGDYNLLDVTEAHVFHNLLAVHVVSVKFVMSLNSIGECETMPHKSSANS